MKRVLPPILALLFTAVLMAPSFVLLQFKLDQARIAEELCVQREVMEEMRTCHGECQLSKRFKALEERSEAGFPTERVHVRYEPAVEPVSDERLFLPTVIELERPVLPAATAEGFGAAVDHVPKA